MIQHQFSQAVNQFHHSFKILITKDTATLQRLQLRWRCCEALVQTQTMRLIFKTYHVPLLASSSDSFRDTKSIKFLAGTYF